MTNSIPEEIRYKFTFNPEMVEKVKKFVSNNKNFNTNSTKIKTTAGKTTISFTADSEKKLFSLHNFLLEIHEITGNRKKKEIEKPKIAISLKGEVNKKFYFNYLLGKDLCQILRDKNIEFSVSKIKENGFHYLYTCPIWITEDDLDNVKKIIKESIYGRSFRIMIINLNILTD